MGKSSSAPGETAAVAPWKGSSETRGCDFFILPGFVPAFLVFPRTALWPVRACNRFKANAAAPRFLVASMIAGPNPCRQQTKLVGRGRSRTIAFQGSSAAAVECALNPR